MCWNDSLPKQDQTKKKLKYKYHPQSARELKANFKNVALFTGMVVVTRQFTKPL